MNRSDDMASESTGVTDRQYKTANNEAEKTLRIEETQAFIHDLIGRHAEYFSTPENRLDFLRTTSAVDFFRIAQHINARLRGKRAWEVRRDGEKGGFLPGIHTPSDDDKPEAFKRGYEAIQEYLRDSNDPVDKKINGVALATEALIVWVHPFNDGNGRTSRFVGKFIESGAVDIEDLLSHTVSKVERGTFFEKRYMYQTRESSLAEANNADYFGMDDKERDDMRQRAETFPSNIDAMHLNIKRLLESDELQDRVRRPTVYRHIPFGQRVA